MAAAADEGDLDVREDARRVAVFVVDPACGRCARGDGVFRAEAGREFVRHVVTAIERLLVHLGSAAPLNCELRVVGSTRPHALAPPGAAMVAAFASTLTDAVRNAAAADTPLADAAAISSAILDVCGRATRRPPAARSPAPSPPSSSPSLGRQYLFILTRVPATFARVHTFVSAVAAGATSQFRKAVARLDAPGATAEERRAAAADALAHQPDLARAGAALAESRLSLHWIDSGTRREAQAAQYEAQAADAVRDWLLAFRPSVQVTYLYALLTERAIVPFASIASSMGIDGGGSGGGGDFPTSACAPWSSVAIQSQGRTALRVQLSRQAFGRLPTGAHTSRLVLRCLLPAADLEASGLLRAPCEATAAALMRPQVTPGRSVADDAGCFAGLMIALADASSVLIAELHVHDGGGRDGTGELRVHTCCVRPVTPLSGLVLRLQDNHRGLEDAAPAESLRRWPAAGAAQQGPALGRHSARVFESHIGAGLQQASACAPPAGAPPGWAALARELARLAAASDPTGVSTVLEPWARRWNPLEDDRPLQRALSGLRASTHAPAAAAAAAAAAGPEEVQPGRDVSADHIAGSRRNRILAVAPGGPAAHAAAGKREDVFALAHAPSSARGSVQMGGRAAGADRAVKAEEGEVAPRPRQAAAPVADAFGAGHTGEGASAGAACAQGHATWGAFPVDDEFAATTDGAGGTTCSGSRAGSAEGGDGNEPLDVLVGQMLEAIALMERSDDRVSGDELLSVFYGFATVLRRAGSESAEEREGVDRLRVPPTSVVRRITTAKHELIDRAGEADGSNAGQRGCLAAFVHAYLQCVLELCRLNRRSAGRAALPRKPKGAGNRLRFVLRMLMCIRSEGADLDQYFAIPNLLGQTFETFLTTVLVPHQLSPGMRELCVEVRGQHDVHPDACSARDKWADRARGAADGRTDGAEDDGMSLVAEAAIGRSTSATVSDSAVAVGCDGARVKRRSKNMRRQPRTALHSGPPAVPSNLLRRSDSARRGPGGLDAAHGPNGETEQSRQQALRVRPSLAKRRPGEARGRVGMQGGRRAAVNFAPLDAATVDSFDCVTPMRTGKPTAVPAPMRHAPPRRDLSRRLGPDASADVLLPATPARRRTTGALGTPDGPTQKPGRHPGPPAFDADAVAETP